MRIIRLSLENWRGVAELEVEFSDGVTLIEGPNEIGKSTIVEALHMLFAELDSSKKQSVKSIQPVGQDVGSRVEAEIVTGDFRFVFSKVYNKKTQTELKILAPQPEQLTGREAHERVERILRDTVDMALWDALLVEQGKEIAGASLADSHGLALALDEAAGSTSPEQEDSDLYSSVQAEYEKYFTLKAGNSRFANLANEVEDARNALEEVRDDLKLVETDSIEHVRCLAECRRLEAELPRLKEIFLEHEASWQAITSLQQNVDLKQKDCDTAQQFLDTAIQDQERRKQLVTDLADGVQMLQEKQDHVEPLVDRAKNLKASSKKAEKALKDTKAKWVLARATASLAREDQQHIHAVGELKDERGRLVRLQGFDKCAAIERTTLAGIKIDAAGLESLRDAQREWQVAAGIRDTAISAIEITAEQDLTIALNDKQLKLAAGEVEQRDIAAELLISIPDVVSIRVTPSQSVADLEADVSEYKVVLDGFLAKYAVKHLADAVALEDKRINAERDLKAWTEKARELLGDQVEADLESNVTKLQERCDAYLVGRLKDPVLPTDLAEANDCMQSTEDVSQTAENEVGQRQSEYERLKEDYGVADADQRVAAQEVTGLEIAQQGKQAQLDTARKEKTDDDVDVQVVNKRSTVKIVQGELQLLTAKVEAASPESTETLLTNAREVRDRAEDDQCEQKNRLLVLEDRLTQAQANGRFEVLERGERELEELESQYQATETRAKAAALLWETINKYRDETRKAYVRPLKEGIERLGRIVFGEDFSVELGEDWTLISRTHEGKTLPFEDLSIGAKEQLGILTRLAAARIVSSQGGVPLIIDDALGFSDPGRLEKMGAAIASAGKECQIILLTCTPGRFTHVGSAEVVRI